MEPGSAWPGHVGDSENVVTVVEREEGLLQRIRERLDSLRRRGEHVRIAVLACNEATDVASVARRAELAQELLAAVASAGFGRLVLTAAERASIQLRRNLLSLADTLIHTRCGQAVTVSVRLHEATVTASYGSGSSRR
jgi:glutamate racemase